MLAQNSRLVGAKNVYFDLAESDDGSVDDAMLSVMDDGRGLHPSDCHDMFAEAIEESTTGRARVEYGESLLRAGLVLGDVVLLLSRTPTLGRGHLLSAMLLAGSLLPDLGEPAEKATILLAQLVWCQTADGVVTETNGDFVDTHRWVFRQYSPLKTVHALLERLSQLTGNNLILISRLKTFGPTATPVLQTTDNPPDIMAAGGPEQQHAPASLREFLALQYLKPNVIINISGAPVVPRHPLAGLYRINAYTITGASREQLIDFKRANLASLKETAARQRQRTGPGSSNTARDGSTLHSDAELARVKIKIAEMQEQALEVTGKVRLPSGLTFSCGINISARARQGLLLYKTGRLVHHYKPVGLQALQDPWHDYGCGGVVCVLDLPDDQLETTPYHDRLLRRDAQEVIEQLAGDATWQYWVDFRADEGLEAAGDMPRFWQSMGYDIGERLEAWKRPPHPKYASQRLIYAPVWLFCTVCKAWRTFPLPEGVDLQQIESTLWSCDQHANPLRRACLHDPQAEIRSLRRQERTLERSAMQRYVALHAQHALVMYTRGEPSPAATFSPGSQTSAGVNYRNLVALAGSHGSPHGRSVALGVSKSPGGRTVVDPRLVAFNRRGGAAITQETSLTGAPLAIYPGLSRDEALRRNLKRCIGHLLPETHPFWRENDLQTASAEMLRAVPADVIIKEHKETTCQAVAALEEEVEEAKRESEEAKKELDELLETLLPLVIILNGGRTPSTFEIDDGEALLAAMEALDLEGVQPGWMLDGAANTLTVDSDLS